MTELQTGLLMLGLSAVVGVFAFNKWQERRHRKLADHLQQARQGDVLPTPENPPATEAENVFSPNAAQSEHATPSLSDKDLDESSEHSPSSEHIERLEPVLHVEPAAHSPALSAAGHMTATHNIPPPPYLLSPSLDYIASFEVAEPIPAQVMHETQRALLNRIQKPIHWIGFNEASREWISISEHDSGQYRGFQVGLQLANRQGALSDGELSIFHLAMHDLSARIMAISDLPPCQPTLDAAIKLDAFCARVDIQIGLNVISQGSLFAGTKLRALAEADGLMLDDAGSFVRYDDNGLVLYRLQDQEASVFSNASIKTMSTHGITFLLDVPRVAQGERAFQQMLEQARRFAEVLPGVLVDDNHQTLSEDSLEPIRRQIAQFQNMMAEQNIPAGSASALRLFS